MSAKIIVLVIGVVLFEMWSRDKQNHALTKSSAGRGQGSGKNRLAKPTSWGAGSNFASFRTPRGARYPVAAGTSLGGWN